MILIFCAAMWAQAQITGLSDWDICLDPGHSRTENMGIYGYSEAERNVRVALRLGEMLLNETDIDTVYLTRTDDQRSVSLSERTNFANAVGVTWFHSIHSDASSGPGANSTLLLWGQHSNGQEKVPNGGKAMADIMVVNLSAGMRIPTRGSIGDCSFYSCAFFGPYLHVNRETNMPSELSESGFHTNPRQNQLFMNDDWKRLEARMFFWSILDYHQIERPVVRILTGIVSDFDNTVPINGAEISVEDQNYITDTYEVLFQNYTSDPDLLHNGFYYFENIEQDSVSIVVQADGYYADTANVTMNNDFFTFSDFHLVSTRHPYVILTTPLQGDTAFSILEDIVIRFSRPMERASVESTLVVEPDLEYTLSWWDGDHELHIRSDSLHFDFDYSITISGQAEDTHDHPFDGNGDGTGGDDFILTFRTGSDYYAPELLDSYPFTNATGIELKPVISLTYDEQLDSASLTPEIFKLERFVDKSTVPGEFAHYVVEKQSVVNFFPSENLQPDEIYVTRIYPGLLDLLGNQITVLKSIPFRSGTDDITVTILDDFELGVENWWQPNGAGGTTGYKEGIYRSADGDYTNVLTASSQSMELFYNWDLNAGAWLIREYLSGGAPRDVIFNTSNFLPVYIFGNGSGNKFRFAIDEGNALSWPDHEVSQWYTIDWLGWKLVEWDLSDPDQVGIWLGNRILDGTRYRFDSFQFTYEEGAGSSGIIYLDDLRIIQKFNVLNLEKEVQAIPTTYSLSQNFPNPFNPTTEIDFSLLQMGPTTLKIYNMLGQEVATLVDTEMLPGNYSVRFNAQYLSSGTYIYVLRSGSTVLIKKMVLLK
jgi:N-acetylmuramoyl-L-alanine amidase